MDKNPKLELSKARSAEQGGLRGEYSVIGPPGTGKTYFIQRQVEKICHEVDYVASNDATWSPAIVCSLTRTAAAEAAGRVLMLPDGAVGTLHALCLRSQGQDRLPVLTRKMVAAWNDRYPHWALSWKNNDPDGETAMDDEAPREGPGDWVYQRVDLRRHRMEDPDSWSDSEQSFWSLWEPWKRSMGAIDWTDMISMADQHPPFGADHILCDEAQDMSRLEQHVLSMWAQHAKSLILCGDPRQALYTWRGAHPDRLIDFESTRQRVLSQSHRLPQAVKDCAEHWVIRLGAWSQYQYSARDDPGEVRDLDGLWSSPTSIAQAAIELEKTGTVMILATCGYMLTPLVATLREFGVPFANPWRRHEGAWNPLRTRRGAVSMGQRLATLLSGRAWTCADLHAVVDPLEAAPVLQRGAKAEIKRRASVTPDAQVDFADLAGWFQDEPLSQMWGLAYEQPDQDRLIAWWAERVSAARWQKPLEYCRQILEARDLSAIAEPPLVFPGTIHSVKGGEADHVILLPDLPPAAEDAWERKGDDEGYLSIVRQFYVGMTRAKQSLWLVVPQGRAVDW